MNDSLALAICQSKLNDLLDNIDLKDLELLKVAALGNLHWYSMREEQPVIDFLDKLIALKKEL